MSDPLYYDFDGEPIDQARWVCLFASPDRHVAYTVVGDGWEVSTVWLGLNHQFGDGVPLIYETMVFNDEDGGVWQERTTNRDAALACHDQALAWAQHQRTIERR